MICITSNKWKILETETLKCAYFLEEEKISFYMYLLQFPRSGKYFINGVISTKRKKFLLYHFQNSIISLPKSKKH